MTQDDLADEEITRLWHAFASQHPGFVGYYLSRYKDHEGATDDQLRETLGIDDRGYSRLQGMPLPRASYFPSDAYRIAESCNLQNPVAFVRTMLLARDLVRVEADEQRDPESNPQEVFMAAFDANEDLFVQPKEE